MIFNSIDFLVFLPIVFAIYWVCPGTKLVFRNLIIVTASYIFYGWWDWRFLTLILFSTLVDFFVGHKMNSIEQQRKRKYWLMTSITVNLGLLGFFKYYNFFVNSFTEAFTFLGAEIHPGLLSIILPVGISFYTFQTLSYSIDIYRKKIKPTDDFIAFAAFVSFFPQLVAGPIERAAHLLPQFTSKRRLTYDVVSSGAKLIIWGLFLKLVLADRAGLYVDAVYNNVVEHDGLTFIFATILFAFQIYGDFAGYSLIAIGTAKLFDFDLMQNFNRPYFAASVGEFWRRWHISLSTWFRDYLYIPLGGNRCSKPRWMYNLFITFVISGLWHGANWTFVVWGALNGLYLIAEVLITKKSKSGLINIILTFSLINFAWIFFRANSISDAFYIIEMIFSHPGELFIGKGADFTASIYAVIAICILLMIEVYQEFLRDRFRVGLLSSQIARMTVYGFVVILILYLGVFGHGQFIYFQF